MTQDRPRKIIFFISEDWYFWSHRVELARRVKLAGYNVSILTRVRQHGEKIKAEGFGLLPLELRRRGRNPWQELKVIRELIRVYRAERPDIVHHVALKPILYGSLAARIARVPTVVNALAGLGYVFTSTDWKARIARPFVLFAYRFFLNRANTRVIIQNPDDMNLLTGSGALNRSRAVMVRGSGVDTEIFTPSSEPDGPMVILFASRMLWDKGIGVFIEAVRLLRGAGANFRAVLVGDGDAENPATVPPSKLDEWQRDGLVEWWGRRDDMPAVFSQAHIVCLPSYREGLPKVLIEAAACGRAIVATDVPGCREIVRQGENGLLVPVKNAPALADALRRLMADPALRQRLGKRSREIAVAEFSIDRVVNDTLAVYRELLPSAP